MDPSCALKSRAKVTQVWVSVKPQYFKSYKLCLSNRDLVFNVNINDRRRIQNEAQSLKRK